MQNNNKRILGLILIFLAIVAIGICLVADSEILVGKFVSIPVESNMYQLNGTYYEGEIDFGVMVLEGFGSDQVTMRSLVNEFNSRGFHVFTFDFTGQGRSPGGLGYPNASTKRLTYQVIQALGALKYYSELDYDQIFIFGHSLGARVALQTATMLDEPVKALVLAGTQINLETNIQSEVFTGTQDAYLEWVQALNDRNPQKDILLEVFTGTQDADLEWVQGLNDRNPQTDILLVSGRWDDILTPEAAKALFDKLTENGGGEVGYSRDTTILQGLIHIYEPFSYKVFNETFEFLNRYVEPDVPITGGFAQTRIAIWVVVAFWLVAGVWLLGGGQAGEENLADFEIVNIRRFLIGKTILWLVAIPVAGIIATAIIIVPLIGIPMFSLIYVCSIGGYGILLLLLYWLGRMPGVEGLLIHWRVLEGKSNWLVGGLIGIGLLGITALFAHTGWFYVFPLNARFIWLIVFTPITAIGFWIFHLEMRLLAGSGKNSLIVSILYYLIWLLPFIGIMGFLAWIGSISSLVRVLQGMVILLLALGAGRLLKPYIRNSWVVALYQAFLLYWLILPQGVLFR